MRSVDRAAETARQQAIELIATTATEELPPSIAVERSEDGLRLSGPRLTWRWANDTRLRGLVAMAARRMA